MTEPQQIFNNAPLTKKVKFLPSAVTDLTNSLLPNGSKSLQLVPKIMWKAISVKRRLRCSLRTINVTCVVIWHPHIYAVMQYSWPKFNLKVC